MIQWTITLSLCQNIVTVRSLLFSPEDLFMMHIVWADHANLISTSYSGTGALKTDFTRTGKRTKQGLLQDGYNSVSRYFKNNFFDGPRQVRTA